MKKGRLSFHFGEESKEKEMHAKWAKRKGFLSSVLFAENRSIRQHTSQHSVSCVPMLV